MDGVSGKVLIDTNVLIYATLERDSRFSVAQSVLLGNQSGPIDRYISVQNLAEMYPNLTGSKMAVPDTPSIARQKIESIASLSTVYVLPLTVEIQKIALELCERYNVRKQKFFDIQLVATMVAYKIPTLITENTADFNGIAEINTINPFS